MYQMESQDNFCIIIASEKSGQMFGVNSSLSIFKPIIFMNIGGKGSKHSGWNIREPFNDTSISVSISSNIFKMKIIKINSIIEWKMYDISEFYDNYKSITIHFIGEILFWFLTMKQINIGKLVW